MAVRFVVRTRDGQNLREELAFPFDQSRIVLGRSAAADVRIPSPTVSESHASVQLRGTDWVVMDLGSRNGTKHNGQRLVGDRTRKLQDGDLLALGNYVLSFHTGVVMTEPMSAERTAELARRLWREAQSAQGVQLPAAHLRVINGERAGERIEVPAAPSRLHIGQHETCQLILPDSVLLRDTLEVIHDLEGVLIRSMAGEPLIQLSGHRYKARRLRDRDELQVGTTRLLFEEPAQHAIDALKGAPDLPLPAAPQPPAAVSSSPSEPLERTQAELGVEEPVAPVTQRSAAAPVAARGPSFAEMIIYALAISVLIASGLALFLLLRAR